MFHWLKKKRKPYDREEILNDGLELAMEFGEHWLQPIQQRLRKIYPELTQGELDEFNSICQSAMRFGHDTIYSMVQESGNAVRQEKWEKVYLSKFPWVNSGNLKALYNQGRYYAWKDFGV